MSAIKILVSVILLSTLALPQTNIRVNNVTATGNVAAAGTVTGSNIPASIPGTGTCVNQFVRVLNAGASPTCATVGSADLAASLALITPSIDAASGISLNLSGNLTFGSSTNNLSVFSATTSAQLRGVLSDETGTGAAVFAGGNIGAATATSLNGLTITSSTGTLTIANGKTLTANNSIAISGTDGTTLTGPASPPAGGVLSFGVPKFQFFSANGTFTIPIGVTGIKATDCGGGGAGGGASTTQDGGGGGAGGTTIKYLSGLTPGNTLSITIGSGGTGVSAAAGGNGTATTIASGTQTITSIVANGGTGGLIALSGNGANGGAGGTAGSGGDFNLPGNGGQLGAALTGGTGGASLFGGAGTGATGFTGNNAGGFCSGGGGAGQNANAAGGNGSGGAALFEWVN